MDSEESLGLSPEDAHRVRQEVNTWPVRDVMGKKARWSRVLVGGFYETPPETRTSHKDLTRSELKHMIDTNCLVGKPVLFEHKKRFGRIGRVVGARQAGDGTCLADIVINGDKPISRVLWTKIRDHQIVGLSLSHFAPSGVSNEISLCIVPQRPGSYLINASGRSRTMTSTAAPIQAEDGTSEHTMVAGNSMFKITPESADDGQAMRYIQQQNNPELKNIAGNLLDAVEASVNDRKAKMNPPAPSASSASAAPAFDVNAIVDQVMNTLKARVNNQPDRKRGAPAATPAPKKKMSAAAPPAPPAPAAAADDDEPEVSPVDEDDEEDDTPAAPTPAPKAKKTRLSPAAQELAKVREENKRLKAERQALVQKKEAARMFRDYMQSVPEKYKQNQDFLRATRRLRDKYTRSHPKEAAAATATTLVNMSGTHGGGEEEDHSTLEDSDEETSHVYDRNQGMSVPAKPKAATGPFCNRHGKSRCSNGPCAEEIRRLSAKNKRNGKEEAPEEGEHGEDDMEEDPAPEEAEYEEPEVETPPPRGKKTTAFQKKTKETEEQKLLKLLGNSALGSEIRDIVKERIKQKAEASASTSSSSSSSSTPKTSTEPQSLVNMSGTDRDNFIRNQMLNRVASMADQGMLYSKMVDGQQRFWTE